jgi:hypothetical protein
LKIQSTQEVWMSSRRRKLIRTLGALIAALLLAARSEVVWSSDLLVDLRAQYRAQVDMRLDLPVAEIQRYSQLTQAALATVAVPLEEPQYVAVVDRDPNVQAFMLFWRSATGDYTLVGASPVSTGRPGEFDHFETPLGVFLHNPDNPDYRAEGTRNSLGIRGYGAKGMRIYDFGWQFAKKGWGNGESSTMRLQMHATDPDLLERRLGSIQSKGCIRIPGSLNRFLDHYGVLDADYERAVQGGRHLWVLDPQRRTVANPGRYLVVIESGRQNRPDWSPMPYIPHLKPV